MAMTLAELITDVHSRIDYKPFWFVVGQQVRVKNGCSRDGQTGRHWDGAMAVVASRVSTGLHKEHWYDLRLPSGEEQPFREDELDYRYARVGQ